MKKRMKKSLVGILILMLTFTVFSSVPIIANAAYSYPAYFEVTKPQDGKDYAVYHTEPNGDSSKGKINVGTCITVERFYKNTYGNIWYKFKKGDEFRWIYSEYVSYRGTISDYSATMETINGGKYWTKPWSSETSKYTSSAEYGNGKVIKVSKKINRNGTIWYKVYNESKFIYSGNVKKHTCTKTTISRYNYKSVSATQHSYDYTYRLCNNSTCANYSQTKTANTTADHSFNDGICSKCKYWKVKSKTDISNVKYIVTTDNAKVHKGPYGSCETVKTLSKGTTITVTQSVKNYEDHTWYKYGGGYIFSDYVKKHSSCTWNSGEWITKATCTASGSKKYTCTLCGATKTEAVAALGHNYVDGVCSRCKAWKVKSKTDISNVKYVVTTGNAKVHKGPYGSCETVKTLSKGTTITVTQSVKNYEDHTWYKYGGGYIFSDYVKKHSSCTWNSGEWITKATCTASGSKKYTCTLCGATKTSAVNALGHNYVDGVCSRCKAWKVKSTTDINNLKYVVTTDNAKVHKGPYGSCDTLKTLSKGTVITVTQSVKNYEDHTWYKYSGGYIYSDYVKKHASCTWNSGEWITKATCTASGSKKYTCTLCGATKTSAVNALGHNYVDGVCSRCKAWKVKSTTDINNLKYVVTTDNAKVHKGPYGSCDTLKTLSKGTVITVTQSVKNYEDHTWYKYSGGYIYSDYVKKHASCTWNSGEWITKPTCTKGGSKKFTCTLCGATKSEPVNALGHKYVNSICSRCKAWKVKSITNFGSVKYVVTTDNAKVHKGPYGSCDTVKTLSKGTTITVTQSVKNYEDHIWYKYSGGYIYSDYVLINDVIFHGGKSIKVTDVLGETAFKNQFDSVSSTKYNPKLSYMLAGLSRSVYDKDNIVKSFMSLGFFDYKIKDYGGLSTKAAHCIGKQKLNDGTTLVLISIRGTKDITNWISNLNINTVNKYHKGFDNSANNVLNTIKSLCGGEIPTNNVKYVITGHSLGAATGNLVAVKLLEAGVPISKVYDYNFACPDVARATFDDWNPSGKYDNIFNIQSAKDTVGEVPGVALQGLNDTNWGKFGRSYWFSKDWSKASEVNLDSNVKEAHDAKNYVEYMSKYKELSAYKLRVDVSYARLAVYEKNIRKLLGVYCPVDVDVYNSNGKLVARIKDNEVAYIDENNSDVLVFVENDHKYVFVPSENNYDIRLTGTDNGKMRYTVVETDIAKQEIISQKTFDDVSLNKGKTMETASLADKDVDNTKLYVIDNVQDIVAEINTDGVETELVSMNKVSVLGVNNRTYSGKSITQSITVKYGNTTLKKETDYIVAYKSNKNVGKATVTITGKGKYIGTIKKTFNINPKSTSLSKVSSPKSKQIKVTWKKQATQTTGYQIQYSTDKSFKKGNKTVTVSSTKTTGKTISKLKGRKKYYVRVRTYKTVNGTKYYSSWSKSKSITTKK